jgi:hypothetical protein
MAITGAGVDREEAVATARRREFDPSLNPTRTDNAPVASLQLDRAFPGLATGGSAPPVQRPRRERSVPPAARERPTILFGGLGEIGGTGWPQARPPA